MIRTSAHHPDIAGRHYTTAKLVAAVLVLVVICALSGIGGAWVALRFSDFTSPPSPPSPVPADMVDREPLATVVPLGL